MAKREGVRLKHQDINNYSSEWEYVDSQNANADSKVGWSTAFFALVISSLLAIGLSVEHTHIWHIIAPFMAVTLTSTLLLVLAMNPNPTSRKIRNSSNVELMFVLRRHVGWEENRIHWKQTNNDLFEQAKKEFISDGLYKDKGKGDNGLAFPDWDTYFQEIHEETIKRLKGTFEDSIRNYRRHIDHKLTLLGVAYLITFPFLLFPQMHLLVDIFKNPYDKFIIKEDMDKLKKDAQLTRRQNYLMRSYIADKFGEEL